MMYRVVKLTKHLGQYRVTIPRELIERCGFKDVEFVRLDWFPKQTIVIQEYHGKDKEKRDVPEDQAGSD